MITVHLIKIAKDGKEKTLYYEKSNGFDQLKLLAEELGVEIGGPPKDTSTGEGEGEKKARMLQSMRMSKIKLFK